ncbi:MAG TPA: ABC transporter ATP-binding protein [Amycolatopsis sp.]|uniref:ABC transporter ATP-binding protein n=1 Tax=Amycolatopsis sp. TaxID=37632 RepID=UPI002B4916D2|nr:ABC transporter ATP-binding protein [Amycolatopsis sp.]HKS46104.1 ABC transporter ATP-binding protein [Amycolatopsis sp.]
MTGRTAGPGGSPRDTGAPDGRDPLFGAGFRLSFQDHHRSPGSLGALRRLPAVVATTARLGWHADRAALVAVVVVQLVVATCTAAGYLLVRDLLNALVGPDPGRHIGVIVTVALVMVGLSALRAGCTALGTVASGRLGPRVSRSAQIRLLECAVGAELAAIEDTRFQNLLGAARRGADAARRVIERAVSLGGGVLSIVTTSAVLAALNPLFVPLLLITIVPRGWSVARNATSRYTSAKRWTELNRHLDQLAMLMTHRESAEEVRANGLGGFLLRHYRRLAHDSEGEQARLARHEARVQLVAGALAGALGVLTYGLLVLLVVTGRMTFPVATTAAFAIRSSTSSFVMLVGQLRQLYEDGLYVQDWADACGRAANAGIASGATVPGAAPDTVVARDLGFRYPDAPRPTLTGIDLYVRRGEVIALVGENGSGKSTLAKVLTGLYLPSSGTVSWDGVAVQDLDRRALFDRIALVTQDFVQWPFTARMNVAVGRADQPVSEARLRAAAETAGAAQVVDGLADGWDALLAREFWGGTNLSGGQWQRMALARAWYRDAPVLVVDEPTAALDPAAEIAVFDEIIGSAWRGRCVVLVTHRLASVARADRIYVVDGGRIVEHGSHYELMRADGRYATMYRQQADQYSGRAATT